MLKAVFLAVMTYVFLPKAYGAQVMNSKDDFQILLNEIHGQTRAEQLKAWDRFEAKYQDIYDSLVFAKGEPGWETKRIKRVNALLDALPGLAPRMMKLFENADEIIRTQEANFVRQFPDMPTDTKVYFMLSALSFNGKAAEIPDPTKSSMFMAVDSIVERGDDLGVLFSHEFFHVYHFGKLAEGAVGRTMATPLWTEGFATYISGIINPGHSDAVLMMDPELASWCDQSAAVASAAKVYLAALDTDGETAPYDYNDWFKMSGPTRPTRRGYCLGLKIIKTLAAQHSIDDMLLWDEAKFSQWERAELTRMSREP